MPCIYIGRVVAVQPVPHCLVPTLTRPKSLASTARSTLEPSHTLLDTDNSRQDCPSTSMYRDAPAPILSCAMPMSARATLEPSHTLLGPHNSRQDHPSMPMYRDAPIPILSWIMQMSARLTLEPSCTLLFPLRQASSPRFCRHISVQKELLTISFEGRGGVWRGPREAKKALICADQLVQKRNGISPPHTSSEAGSRLGKIPLLTLFIDDLTHSKSLYMA
jgi:hypothetical protein